MSMSLYEIDQSILALVDPETGEILDDAALEQLQMERETKLENIACWIKNLTAESAAIRQEEINLAERRKVLERKCERLKKYLFEALNGEKFQTAKCAVTYRKVSKVEISDARRVAEWCEDNGFGDLVVYSDPTVSKNELAKILRSGTQIPGAVMAEGMSMGVK
jgi:gamma-glutamylcysteine synthetase